MSFLLNSWWYNFNLRNFLWANLFCTLLLSSGSVIPDQSSCFGCAFPEEELFPLPEDRFEEDISVSVSEDNSMIGSTLIILLRSGSSIVIRGTSDAAPGPKEGSMCSGL